MRHLFYFFLFILLIPFSCDDSRKLVELEKILAEKEKKFAEKEAEYQSLVKMRDSIFSKKEATVENKNWPANISGKWNGKITCKESNCPDYAVGDIRSDTWEFVSDSLKKSVNVYSNSNQLVRTYAAQMKNKEIHLSFRSDSSSAKKVEMKVLLDNIAAKIIQGSRAVIVNDNCTATFAVELTRP